MKKLLVIISVCFVITLAALLFQLHTNRVLKDALASQETPVCSVTYYEPESKHAFIAQAEALYTYPGERSVVCEVPQNTILTVIYEAVASDPAAQESTGYLYVSAPCFKAPGNNIGWIPRSAVTPYSDDLAARVDSPVIIRQGKAYYDCKDSADISTAEVKYFAEEIRGYVDKRKNGYCLIQRASGDEAYWVDESDVEPGLG